MAKVELRYVKAYADRHGRRRHYFRKHGCKSVALPGLPGSAEFMAAYQSALEGAEKTPIGASKTKPGSISALFVAYYSSLDFKTLRPSTQRGYRSVLEPFRSKWGHLPVKDLQPGHVRKILGEMADTPAQAKNLRKRLRQVMQLAVEDGWRKDNPILAVRPVKHQSDGFMAWSEEDIEAYRQRWAIGTRERLALELLLCTGQRRSDTVGMGPQHVRGDRISVKQLKTSTRLWIPLHPELKAAIDACPTTHMTFLVTQYGEPFTHAGFTNWFVGRAKLAGLVGRTPHGLRKAKGRRLAEAGCSVKEISAVLGDKSLAEIELYTRSADQVRLADSAMDRLLNAPPKDRTGND